MPGRNAEGDARVPDLAFAPESADLAICGENEMSGVPQASPRPHRYGVMD